MTETSAPRVLVCSDRPKVSDRVARAFRTLPARPAVVAGTDEWSGEAPVLVVVDVADASEVRRACLAFAGHAALWALVDGDSADRLLPALAAGCSDYLFYPVSPSELELRWRRLLGEGERDETRLREAEGRFEIVFPSSAVFLGPVVDEVVGACERMAVAGSRSRLNLRVALGEAVANAIQHGSGEVPERSVRVVAAFGEEEVRVTVEDEGRGFDPGAVADPTRPENRDRATGRGLFLIRSLMDEVHFNETGNAITMVYRLAP